MKSILYNLGPDIETSLFPVTGEYMCYANGIAKFLKHEDASYTIRIDIGNYLFLANDTLTQTSIPYIHIIASGKDTTKIEALIEKISDDLYLCPFREKFEIDEDALTLENIQILDEMCFRDMKMKLNTSVTKNTLSICSQEVIDKEPINKPCRKRKKRSKHNRRKIDEKATP